MFGLLQKAVSVSPFDFGGVEGRSAGVVGADPERECDLFISFLSPDGSWSEPRGLGRVLGTNPGLPNVTPDGRFFFYADYSGVLEETDIHWVDTGIFDQFRPPG